MMDGRPLQQQKVSAKIEEINLLVNRMSLKNKLKACDREQCTLEIQNHPK